jgi:hypothetical protein
MKYITIVAIVIVVVCAQERVMYFHNGDETIPEEMNLTDLRNSPIYIAMDW